MASLAFMGDLPTGLELKTIRVYHGIRQLDLAREFGVRHQRISAIERSDRPTKKVVDRYFAALARLRRDA
jgi:transcriptional regulator with XRE-family HTH domain